MERWIKKHGTRLDEIAEEHDDLGMMQGVVDRPGMGATHDVLLVFDHAIVTLGYDNLGVRGVSRMTRFDEV
jgi:hypothetical protein